MHTKGMLVTDNSDDPAYFGGYIDDDFAAIVVDIGLPEEDTIRLARNADAADFIAVARRCELLRGIDVRGSREL